jgi:hypothetical protein
MHRLRSAGRWYVAMTTDTDTIFSARLTSQLFALLQLYQDL